MALKNVFGEVGKIAKNVAGGFLNSTLRRLTGAGLAGDTRLLFAQAKWSGRNDKKDWRVRLQIPNKADALYDAILANNNLLLPLQDSRGMFWPLTPTMQIQHSANYNALSQTHSNYPFQAYQNSQIDSISIIGEFPVQNQQDAQHWVATVNFLRTVTKMFFGVGLKGEPDPLKGNPPPILHLSGYGDHMFQKVPVVVNNFNVELRQGIDYISTKQDQVYRQEQPPPIVGAEEPLDPNSIDQTWAPTISNISVMLTPVYSRQSIKNFSLRDFARGKLNGKGTGEIGFI